MKNFIKKSLLVIIALATFISCENSESIFVKDSDKWETIGDGNWQFSNNELVGEVEDGDSYTITKKSYKNFELSVEFKPDSLINSGIFIRCSNKELNPFNCYEFNIWDKHPDQTNRTGAIVLITPPREIVNTIAKWNTYKIEANDNHIRVWINNILVVDTIDEKLIEGFIGLQAKGSGTIRFRNFSLKEL